MSECECGDGVCFVLCPVHGAPPNWSDRDVLRFISGAIVNINNNMENIMANTDQLSTDVQALTDAFGTLSVDLTTGLTNLHAQIAGLEGSAGDAQALQSIDHNINGLIERVQQTDALVKAADPGAPSGPGDATVETTPARPETPETPAPAPVQGDPVDTSDTPAGTPLADPIAEPSDSTTDSSAASSTRNEL